MIYDLPTIKLRRQEWTIENSSTRQESPFTYAAQRLVWPGQRLGCNLGLPVMERDDGLRWEAFFSSVHPAGKFWVEPARFLNAGPPVGMPLVGGDASGSTIATEGWTPNQARAMIAGQFVQIGNRLRRLLADVVTDANGVASIEIWPKIGVIRGGTQIVCHRPRGVFQLRDAPPVLSWRTGRLLDAFEFAAVEENSTQ